MSNGSSAPLISVVIPTHNRSRLLSESLESLYGQSLPRSRYEVIVVDDGSPDDTADVCRAFGTRMPLRYFRLRKAGISAAKNLGAFASTGAITLFFDDDDVADKDLLRRHLETHERHPEENVAVLGYTTWAPSLEVTPVMHYITDVGHFLFCYSHLKDGQELDYTYFWGGRSSCKRSLLVKHGVFRQEFTFGSEDIELGYRLSKFGLKVIYNRQAIQYMNRPITYDEFCRRCEKQGRSQVWFGRVHADPAIQEYCQLVGAEEKWHSEKDLLAQRLKRVHEVEAALNAHPLRAHTEPAIAELHSLYKLTFNAFKFKGIMAERQFGVYKPSINLATPIRVGAG